MTLKIRILPSSEPYFKSYVDIHFFFSLIVTHAQAMYLCQKIIWFGPQVYGAINSKLNLTSKWQNQFFLKLGIVCFTSLKESTTLNMVIEFLQFLSTKTNIFLYALVSVETRTFAKTWNTNPANGTILKSYKKKIPQVVKSCIPSR